jgi:hypothetical protein
VKPEQLSSVPFVIEKQENIQRAHLDGRKVKPKKKSGHTGQVEQRGRGGDAAAGASAVERREPPRWPSVLATRHLPRRLHVLPDPSSPRHRGVQRARPWRSGRATPCRHRPAERRRARAGEERPRCDGWHRHGWLEPGSSGSELLLLLITLVW